MANQLEKPERSRTFFWGEVVVLIILAIIVIFLMKTVFTEIWNIVDLKINQKITIYGKSIYK